MCTRLYLSIIRDWLVLPLVFLCHGELYRHWKAVQALNQHLTLRQNNSGLISLLFMKNSYWLLVLTIQTCYYITSVCLALMCITSVITHKMAWGSPSHPNVWAWCLRDAVSHCILNVHMQNGLWLLHSSRKTLQLSFLVDRGHWNDLV